MSAGHAGEFAQEEECAVGGGLQKWRRGAEEVGEEGGKTGMRDLRVQGATSRVFPPWIGLELIWRGGGGR